MSKHTVHSVFAKLYLKPQNIPLLPPPGQYVYIGKSRQRVVGRIIFPHACTFGFIRFKDVGPDNS
jgi:hypothetical protein